MSKLKKYSPTPSQTKNWQFSRRQFIKGSLAAVILAQLPLLHSCTDTYVENKILDKKQYFTLLKIQNILFPDDGNGPSAQDFNAVLYVIWVLSDPLINKEDKNYFFNGLQWIDETAQEDFSASFLNLNNKQQTQVIASVAKTDWGESWLSYQLNYIIEAMVSDPIYGFNKNSVGVRWLQHIYGKPQPTTQTKYPEIFKTIQQNGK